jgi:hypothetical protein
MNVEIGTETPIFLVWEYLFRYFVFAVCYSERRKTEREERKVTFRLCQLAGVGGGGGANSNDSKDRDI